MKTAFEPVHSVDDYYDGPRTGIAEYHGVPHHFQSLAWIQKTLGSDLEDERFELTPVGVVGGASVIVHGYFRVRKPVPDLPKGVLRPLQVQWTAVEDRLKCPTIACSEPAISLESR